MRSHSGSVIESERQRAIGWGMSDTLVHEAGSKHLQHLQDSGFGVQSGPGELQGCVFYVPRRKGAETWYFLKIFS